MNKFGAGFGAPANTLGGLAGRDFRNPQRKQKPGLGFGAAGGFGGGNTAKPAGAWGAAMGAPASAPPVFGQDAQSPAFGSLQGAINQSSGGGIGAGKQGSEAAAAFSPNIGGNFASAGAAPVPQGDPMAAYASPMLASPGGGDREIQRDQALRDQEVQRDQLGGVPPMAFGGTSPGAPNGPVGGGGNDQEIQRDQALRDQEIQRDRMGGAAPLPIAFNPASDPTGAAANGFAPRDQEIRQDQERGRDQEFGRDQERGRDQFGAPPPMAFDSPGFAPDVRDQEIQQDRERFGDQEVRRDEASFDDRVPGGFVNGTLGALAVEEDELDEYGQPRNRRGYGRWGG